MNKVDRFEDALQDLFSKERDEVFRINPFMGTLDPILCHPHRPDVLDRNEPDVGYDIFEGVGKKVGLSDFELEILVKEILKDDDLISGLSDSLVLAKMKYGDKVQKLRDEFNEIKSDIESTYQRRLKEYQNQNKNCSFREEFKTLVNILKSYRDGSEISDKMFSVIWTFYQKFSLCENPTIEHHPNNPDLVSVMIQLMDWKKVDDFVEKI